MLYIEVRINDNKTLTDMTIQNITDRNFYQGQLTELNPSVESDREEAFHYVIGLEEVLEEMEFQKSPSFQLEEMNTLIDNFNQKFGWGK